MIEKTKLANLLRTSQLESVFTPNAALLDECARFARSPHRSNAIEKNPLVLHLLDARYGSAWREYASCSHDPEDISSAQAFNQHVYSHLARMCYGVDDQNFGADIHHHMRKSADECLDYALSNIPDSMKKQFEPLNNTMLNQPPSAEMKAVLEGDPYHSFQTLLRLHVGSCGYAGDFDLRRNEASNLAHEIFTNALEPGLFTPFRTGKGDHTLVMSRNIFSAHDSNGKTLAWSFTHSGLRTQFVDQKPGQFDVKSTPINMRKLTRIYTMDGREDQIWVYTTVRNKSMPASLFKALTKSAGAKKPLTLSESVRDRIGLQFAVFPQDDSFMEGGERITIQGATQMRANKAMSELRARSWFASLASDHLLSYIGHIKGNATHISLYDDHATGTNRNSKLAPGHMHRHQLTYDGIRPMTEMEMMHLSALGLLDNMYHVGDRTKDGYNGAAHDIYQLQRSKNAMRLFFPESFYPINEALAKSAVEKASKLRKANTIFLGRPSNEIAIENTALYPPMETGQGSCKTQTEKYSEWNTWPPIGTLFSSS